MATDAKTLAATYFSSWKAHDFDTFRSQLADDVEFTGPMGRAHGADECVQGIEGMSKMVTDMVIKKVFVDGPDVLTWYDLHTADADPIPTANWIHAEDGKITRIEVAFDPRSIAPPGR